MWFSVDDGIANLPEVLRIPKRYRFPAMGAWTLLGGWASHQLTNGFVPDAVVTEMGVSALLRSHLVNCGLWAEDSRGGVRYTLRGCSIPDPEAVQGGRAATAERVRKHRARKQSTAPPAVSDECNGVTCNAVTELRVTPVTPNGGVGGGTVNNNLPAADAAGYIQTNDSIVNLPSSQAQSSPKPGTELAPRKPPRTRIGDDWQPPPDVRHRMRLKYPDLDLSEERRAFINHHQAHGNLMADWTKAFWTWLNNTRKFGPNGPVKVNGHQLSTADKRVAAVLAMKSNNQPPPQRLELT